MQSIDAAINILNNLPIELIFKTFSYLGYADLLNFTNNEPIKQFIIDNYPFSLNTLNNITDEAITVWKLLDLNDNKIYNWCKILCYANIYNDYYKDMYKTEHGQRIIFPADLKEKYIFKLKMGLFLYLGTNYYDAWDYSRLSFEKIGIIFDILKEHPDEFDVKTLFITIKTNDDNFLKMAYRIKNINKYDTREFQCRSSIDTIIRISKFPESNYSRFMNLVKNNVDFKNAYELSTPPRKFTDELVKKFIKLKTKINTINNHFFDSLLIEKLRNKKMLDKIEYLHNKELSIQVIINMMLINNNLLDYLITNNKFYDFEYDIWKKIEYLYKYFNDVFQEIFEKFTIKQQQQIRVKELMEDDSLQETIKYFQIHNISYISRLFSPAITKYQHFKAYTELTESQFNIFQTCVLNGITYEQAYVNATVFG